MAPPDFGRSVNPISTRRGRLCPPHYYWHPRIFIPSYGPGCGGRRFLGLGAVQYAMIYNFEGYFGMYVISNFDS